MQTKAVEILEMDDGDFEAFIKNQSDRDTSAAQMHDWLKEAHEDFPKVKPKTIFNFEKWVRLQHNLPYELSNRDYQSAEDSRS